MTFTDLFFAFVQAYVAEVIHYSAPVKTSKKKNKDHSNLICHYCKFKGHIQLNCQKKKKDEAAEKKRKEEESKVESSKKAANLHSYLRLPPLRR